MVNLLSDNLLIWAKVLGAVLVWHRLTPHGKLLPLGYDIFDAALDGGIKNRRILLQCCQNLLIVMDSAEIVLDVIFIFAGELFVALVGLDN